MSSEAEEAFRALRGRACPKCDRDVATVMRAVDVGVARGRIVYTAQPCWCSISEEDFHALRAVLGFRTPDELNAEGGA